MQHDWFCSTYRDHVHTLAAAFSREVMSELFSKETGCSKGRGTHAPLLQRAPPARWLCLIGEAVALCNFTSRYKRDALGDSSSDAVTAAFFGDGTCNIGQFYECMNMAQLWKLPIIFVVENNKWAIGMDHNRATSDPEIWRKAAAFGMAGEEVDGMDVLAVRGAAQRDRAGPRRQGPRCSVPDLSLPRPLPGGPRRTAGGGREGVLGPARSDQAGGPSDRETSRRLRN